MNLFKRDQTISDQSTLFSKKKSDWEILIDCSILGNKQKDYCINPLEKMRMHRRLFHLFLSKQSLKTKMFMMIFISNVAALLFAGSFFVINDLHIMKSTINYVASSLTALVETHIEAPLYFNDPEAAEETLSSLKENNDILAAGVYNDKNELFASYIANNSNIEKNGSITLDELKSKELLPDGLNHCTQYIESHKTIMFNGKRLGHLLIIAGTSKIMNLVIWYVGYNIFILLAAGLLVYLISSRFMKILAAPVATLTNAVKLISK
ncbi:MAG: hypothetical protein HQK69_01385, partial [Desulfamplus sp.]|nr:hypothetical protein [Desulfamplus sp.]